MVELTLIEGHRKQRKPNGPRGGKLKTPNGMKAFEFACDMEEDLSDIERCERTLRLIAEGSDDSRISDAIFLVANVLESRVEAAEQKRGKIFQATWGFKFAASAV